MKTIYSGLESSGKSLKLAMVAVDVAHRNAKWRDRSGKARAIASNMRFSPDFERYVVEELQLPVIYWRNLEELISFTDCDVFIDEVANYFDARLWADLSLDVRRWLTQGAKMGVEIYGSAQDFAQVDKSFRRLVNNLYLITKLMGSPRPSPTKPPVKRIWGVCMMKGINPMGYNEDKSKFEPTSLVDMSFFLIERKYCEIFDTNQRIERSTPPPLRHVDRVCERSDCAFHKTAHI